ncbi:WXG100 family type VII secretion target [Dactylosporangium matsuzakiense]|uniref:PPE family protein n=1 Tax=Dactylosporangium matsuzakiense TaxID=53360 RepID=A0A9W6NLL6_9ACTN|nr:hypothetical protein [Dactylosporangium matsuzakiense]UWZ46572.1 hypothetical protein Dmats_09190 [Dactylosporangium matsuzakiense]GLL01301.1 hypothetical protein GCM10017581_030420 [Dactylosporangium matsuzakiense]
MPETYQSYRLPDLWKSLAAEDPDAGFTHVNTLNRLRTALEQQRDNLRTHRDRLTESWPPDHSEAAAAFVARINGLLDVMTTTAAATSRITTGVDQTYAALRDARRVLESLMTEFHKHPTAPGLPITVGRPDLDREARQTLITTDATIVRATALIDTALPARMSSIDSGEDVGGARSGLAAAPVTAGGGGGRPPGSGSQSAVLPVPVFNPPIPAHTGIDVGLEAVLTGNPAGPTNSIPSPNFSGVIGGNPVTSRPSHPDTGRPVPFGLPPGSVISAPKPPAAETGQAGPGPIGEAAPVRRPGAAPAESTAGSGLGSTPSGYRDRSYQQYAERRRSRRTQSGNEQWPVAEGVPPVIEPPPARDHDPGPGVVGIDR